MTSETRSPPFWPRRSVTLPFLMLAYPLVFLFYQGGQYCQPVCFQPTFSGVGRLVGLLIVVYLAAVLVAMFFRLEQREIEDRLTRGLIHPPPTAIAVLGIIFASSILYLTLDSLSLFGYWRILLLPLSLGLFLPVWALYMATFPLAIVFSITGIETTESMRLVIRGIVLFVGFPLSAVLQMAFASFMAFLIEGVRN